ncbi:MAG: hypothetical protein FWB72_02335 [Firmicutes bacterium]|nr:hypothetical protein [Bacillota bacterium]
MENLSIKKSKIFRLFATLTAAVMFGVFLAGCVFIVRNEEADLNQVVARVGYRGSAVGVFEITKREMLEAFRGQAGQSLIQQGSSEREAMDQVVIQLVNQQLFAIKARQTFTISFRQGIDGQPNLLNFTHPNFGGNYNSLADILRRAEESGTIYYYDQQNNRRSRVVFQHADEKFFSIYEINEARNAINEAVRGQLERHLGEVKDDWGIVVDEVEDDDFAFTPPRRWPIRETGVREFNEFSQHDFLTPFELPPTEPNTELRRVHREAERRFENQLNDINLTIPLLYEMELQTRLIRKLEEYLNITNEDEANNPHHIDNLFWDLDTKVRQLYTNILQRNRDQFGIPTGAGAEAIGAAQTAFETVFSAGEDIILYYPFGGYFYVNHVLIMFTDAQNAEIARLRDLGVIVTDAHYRQWRQAQANNIWARPRVNGLELTQALPAPRVTEEIFNTMNWMVNDANQTVPRVSRRDRQDAFLDLMHRWNQDEGMFNSPRGYAMFPEDRAAGLNWYPTFSEGAWRASRTGGLYGPVISQFGLHYIFVSESFGAGQILTLECQYGFRMRRDPVRVQARVEDPTDPNYDRPIYVMRDAQGNVIQIVGVDNVPVPAGARPLMIVQRDERGNTVLSPWRLQTVYDVLKDRVLQQHATDRFAIFQNQIAIHLDDFGGGERITANINSAELAGIPHIPVRRYNRVIRQYFNDWI